MPAKSEFINGHEKIDVKSLLTVAQTHGRRSVRFEVRVPVLVILVYLARVSRKTHNFQIRNDQHKLEHDRHYRDNEYPGKYRMTFEAIV